MFPFEAALMKMNLASLPHRFHTSPGALARIAALVALYAVIITLPFFLGYASGAWPLATACAIILAFLGAIAGRSLYRSAENLLRVERYRYQNTLLQTGDTLVRGCDPGNLYPNLVAAIAETVHPRFTTLFSLDTGSNRYRLAADDGNGPHKDIEFAADHPLTALLRQSGQPLIFENAPSGLRRSIAAPAALAVPISFEGSLYGFLLLGEKRSGDRYHADDTTALAVVAKQGALVVKHRTFHDEFRKVHERISNAEKLASVGGLAEGVAHQINNRLNHFSMVSGELKYEIDSCMQANADLIAANDELKTTFSYLVRISDSLIDNVKRTDGIIKGILNYARAETREAVFTHFSLQEIIDLTCDLMKVKHSVDDLPLECEGVSSGDVYGIRSQIMDCLNTVIENAYEATCEKTRSLDAEDAKAYHPRIRIALRRTADAVTIEVSDNGDGIADTARQKVFAPFFTTKSSYKSSTGIGLYVAKRLIEENHRGRIWFESVRGEGASFFIELPYRPRTP